MFKRIVNAVEVAALAAAAFTLVMLFANEPGGSAKAGGPGAQVFAANCARCHGSGGGGGVGPKLAGEVSDRYSVDEEIDVVKEGPGSMPSFEESLSDEEIQQVVEYTRSL